MTELKVLPEWASDTNFNVLADGSPAAAYDNQPTKVEPATAIAAQGFRPGKPVGAQYVNYQLNELAKNTIAEALNVLLDFREAPCSASTTTQLRRPVWNNGEIVLGFYNDVARRQLSSFVDVAEADPFPVDVLYDMVTNGSRLVAIGSVGPGITINYSDDNGNSWATPTVQGGENVRRGSLHWDPTRSKFVTMDVKDSDFLEDANGAGTWTNNGPIFAGAAASTGRLTINPGSGKYVALHDLDDVDGEIEYGISTDGGTTWTTGVFTIATTNSVDLRALAYDATRDLYVCIVIDRTTAPDTHYCYTSSDGATWSLQATLTSYNGVPSVGVDSTSYHNIEVVSGIWFFTYDTGLLYSTDAGANWVDIPLGSQFYVHHVDGRLFLNSTSGDVYQSSGCVVRNELAAT